MTFRYRVFYRETALYDYDKVKWKFVRARSAEQAKLRFREKYGIEPMRVK